MSTDSNDAAQLRYPPNVQYNGSKVYTIKFLSSCFAGAAAGTLGLQTWLGFGLFAFSTLLTFACLYVKCKAKPANYAPGGLWDLLNPGQENMFSFLLVWTLFYGIVHGKSFSDNIAILYIDSMTINSLRLAPYMTLNSLKSSVFLFPGRVLAGYLPHRNTMLCIRRRTSCFLVYLPRAPIPATIVVT